MGKMNSHKSKSPFIQIIQIFKPWDLLITIFYYALGFSMARFTNRSISWSTGLMGLLSSVLLTAALFFSKKGLPTHQV